MSYLVLAVGTLIVACSPGHAKRDTQPAIVVRLDASPQRVEVVGLAPAALGAIRSLAPDDSLWPSLFAVRVERDMASVKAATIDARATPPVIGRYIVDDHVLRFEPRFPFTSGTSYRVDVDTSAFVTRARSARVSVPSDSSTDRPAFLMHRFALASNEAPRTTRVTAVHPSAARVPSNLLRWYIETSAPMEMGNALDHVHLMDESGREVRGAFLTLEQELWNHDRTRLTLLFDPGRVKRGVRTNLESGAPLVAGRRYRLVVDDGWVDGSGARLASGFEYAFEAVAADRSSPDPTHWRLTVPRAGTRAPLVISFGEALDHALAARLLTVADDRATPVAGHGTVTEGDSGWSFQPAREWSAGGYALRVGGALEDLAGNNLVRVFDVDRRADSAAIDRDVAGTVRTVPFRIDR